MTALPTPDSQLRRFAQRGLRVLLVCVLISVIMSFIFSRRFLYGMVYGMSISTISTSSKPRWPAAMSARC